MIWNNVFSSYKPLEKCSAALAAGISATAATGGSILNAANVQASSHQGRAYARWAMHEQEAFAREQWQNQVAEQRYMDERNRRWQLEDTASEREWNSAQAVVSRLKAAGINPYLAMSNGAAGVLSGGSASSPSAASGSAPSGSVPSAVSPSYAPVPDIGRGISDAASIFLQGIKMDADISRIRTENIKDSFDAMAIWQRAYDNHLIDGETYHQKVKENAEWLKFSEDREKQMKLMTSNLDAELKSKMLDNARIELQNHFAVEEHQWKRDLTAAELRKVSAEVQRIYTEASEMVANGASERELKNWLTEEKKAVVKDFYHNIMPQHEAESYKSQEESKLAEGYARDWKNARNNKAFRIIDNSFDYIGRKLNTIIKFK